MRISRRSRHCTLIRIKFNQRNFPPRSLSPPWFRYTTGRERVVCDDAIRGKCLCGQKRHEFIQAPIRVEPFTLNQLNNIIRAGNFEALSQLIQPLPVGLSRIGATSSLTFKKLDTVNRTLSTDNRIPLEDACKHLYRNSNVDTPSSKIE